MCRGVQFFPPCQGCGRILGLGVLYDGPDHFVGDASCILETWCKVTLNMLESVSVGLEGSEGDAVRPGLGWISV